MNEINQISEDTATQDELSLASAYLSSGMATADAIRMAQARVRSGLEGHVCSLPCSGWCTDQSNTTWIMRFVGNDMTLTRKMQMENLDKGLRCSCSRCSEKHFKIADALDYHLTMLHCVHRKDDRGATQAARARGEILSQLGYKVA